MRGKNWSYKNTNTIPDRERLPFIGVIFKISYFPFSNFLYRTKSFKHQLIFPLIEISLNFFLKKEILSFFFVKYGSVDKCSNSNSWTISQREFPELVMSMMALLEMIKIMRPLKIVTNPIDCNSRESAFWNVSIQIINIQSILFYSEKEDTLRNWSFCHTSR